MKKILFASISIAMAVSASAQSGKVITAYNSLSAYDNKEGASYLEEGAKAIDLAAQDETTSKSAKTWWYRAKIYTNITTEPTVNAKYPKASLEALQSFQMIQKLNDPKFKDWADAVIYMKTLTAGLFNDGVGAFKDKKYADGYAFFIGISEINDLLLAHGSKATEATVVGALRNAGLCAENAKDTTGAINAYKKYLVVAPDSLRAPIYASLVTLNMKRDLPEAKRLTDEGLAKYPDNSALIINKINFFVNDGKQAEALDYLKKLSAMDPNNKAVIYNLAGAYLETGDTTNAKKEYEHVLSIDPDYFDANKAYGALLYNMGNKINNVMNSLGMSAADLKKTDMLKIERNKLYEQGRPYLQKASAKNPNDGQVKMALNNIVALTGK